MPVKPEAGREAARTRPAAVVWAKTVDGRVDARAAEDAVVDREVSARLRTGGRG